MTQDCARPLNIKRVETALDKLLEQYRQALRAVELLPTLGRVPDGEYRVNITPLVDRTRRRRSHSRTPTLPPRTPHADWISNHLAVRPLARMFLRSHIRSKLRTFADHLEVERFASGHMNANTTKRLDDVVRKLRDYDKRLAQRRTLWLRLLGQIWAIAAPLLIPILPTYLSTFVIHGLHVTAAGLLWYFSLYLLYFVLFTWMPIYKWWVLGGFRWKRLILMGQIGDINIDIATNVVLRWVRAPEANTYESENHLFGTLELPKPNEFPWDLLLTPHRFMLAALALSFFSLALALAFSMKELSWPILIAFLVFLGLSFLCLQFTRRPILRAMQERRQRSAC